MFVLLPCRFTCPFVEKFSIDIETFYKTDAGENPNVFSLSPVEKNQLTIGNLHQGAPTLALPPCPLVLPLVSRPSRLQTGSCLGQGGQSLDKHEGSRRQDHPPWPHVPDMHPKASCLSHSSPFPPCSSPECTCMHLRLTAVREYSGPVRAGAHSLACVPLMAGSLHSPALQLTLP